MMIGLGALFLTYCVWLPGWVGLDSKNGGSNGESFHPRKGENAYIEVAGESEVWVSTDEKALDELLAFSSAKNEAAIRQLMYQGCVFVCYRHTKVTILDPGLMSTTVRIMEGKHAGRTGIVANKFLRKN